MNLSVAEKIMVLANRKNLTLTELAQRIGTTRQNLNNKMSRSNFSENEIHKIAEALDCDVDILFTSRDTGDTL